MSPDMHPLRIALLALILLATAACTSEPAPTPAPAALSSAAQAEPAQAESAKPSGQELTDAIQQPMDRARAVEGELMKAKDAVDAELDQQDN